MLATAFALTGCDKVTHFFDPAEVKACEAYTLETLASPSTYKRIDVITHDEKVTKARLKELSPNRPDWVPNDDPGIKTVGIQYDAQNGYGAIMRGGMVCAFETERGEVKDNSVSLDGRASAAASHAKFRDLVERGIVPNMTAADLGPLREYQCCLW
ncbi:hypothetical protein [Novosphingobium guangzhouense]|uniref:Uncharacterized protein n=1 Tax=Novosphingobium guangzhouense TaxID=1850347 RepID=A0A2K2G381_9SPHN|nr:hypothetical protein [Novosphingobium guangzhouense]PNU05481.1 hypothetical protein A8V01_15970 [Novosphingobium guangzhouense]